MIRNDKRKNDELRPVKITRGYTKYAPGSVLIEVGETRVLCTAMVDDKVPPFLRGEKRGWVTAEYEMLPSATDTRRGRDRTKGKIDGRTVEIQRLIGRSLRAVVDMEALGERTVWVDCDVLQADGGTRTASITGAYIALADALQSLVDDSTLETMPLRGCVAATSVGILEDEAILDLCYQEDFAAAVDMNIVMTDAGEFIEIQGTGEERPFTESEQQELMALGKKGIAELIARQQMELGMGKKRKTIVLATGNADKAREIHAMLDGDYEVLTMKDVGIDIDIVEDGDTFEENALIKVRAIEPLVDLDDAIIMADDSGLSVDILGGAPGIYSARYAGEDVSYDDNNVKLLAEMANVPEGQRGAEFVCAVALILPGGEEMTVRGIVRGTIADELHGGGGFGYDPLFIVDGLGKTYAELAESEKNKISHRAVAVKKAKAILDAL